MYPRYFGLKEPSFAITPDPQYLYLSRQHREALAHLLYGADQGGGFVLLTGEVGTGKTMVCRAFLEEVPDDVEVALVLNPAMTAVELMHAICDEFGVDVPDGEPSVKVLVDRLNAYLLDAHGRGRHPVLIIDEAQNLRPKVLEQIRLLTNLETTKQKLLQIFLIGQPELRALIASVDLRQLNQRITARFHLQPLGAAETAAYVEHRIAVAGVDRPLFSRAALRRVHRCSGGVPRLINLICDRSLLGTAVSRQLQVTPAIVRCAAREVRGSGLPVTAGLGRGLALAAAVVLALGLGIWLGVSGLAGDGATALRELAGIVEPVRQTQPTPAADLPDVQGSPAETAAEPQPSTISAALIADAPVTAPASIPMGPGDGLSAGPEPMLGAIPADDPEPGPQMQANRTPTEPPDQADIEPSASPSEDDADTESPSRPTTPRLSLAEVRPDAPDTDPPLELHSESDAIAALVGAWGLSPPPGAHVSCQSIRALGLECERDNGRWSDLRMFDRPAALRLTPPSPGKPGYLPILALDDELAIIGGADGPRRATVADLDERWSGDYLLLWRPPRPGVRYISRKDEGEDVRWLRERLAALPDSELTDSESPVYDTPLVRAVQGFQRGHGLSPDGIAGPRTLILLNTLVNEHGPTRVSQSP